MSKNYIHRYTDAQKEFLRTHVSGRPYLELTMMFNQEFGTNLNAGRIKASIKRYGLKNGRSGRFEKGCTVWNKGMKGISFSPETQFQKGNMPQTYRPVGSERISKDGYLEVKVADPRTWRGKHRLVWEAANGPVPEGHAVIFADGNPLNIDIDNLLLISRAELLVANRHGLIKKNAAITKTGVQLARLMARMHEVSRRDKG